MGSWAVCCGLKAVAEALLHKKNNVILASWNGIWVIDLRPTPPLPMPPCLFCHQLCVGHIKVVCVWDCHYTDHLSREMFPFITELKLVFSFKGNSGGLILLVVIVCTQDDRRFLIHFFYLNDPTCSPKMKFHNNVTDSFFVTEQQVGKKHKDTKIACQSIRRLTSGVQPCEKTCIWEVLY